VGTYVALALGVFVWLDPRVREFSNQVMSDVPGMALMFALFLLERRADRARSWKRELALGAAIGIASYLRTALAFFLPAVIAVRVWAELAGDRRTGWPAFLRDRVVLVSLATVLLVLPWSARNSIDAPIGAVDQTSVHSYGVAARHVDVGDPDSPMRTLPDMLRAAPESAVRILSLLGSRMEASDARPASVALGAIIVLAVAFLGWKTKDSAAVYFFIVLAVLLVLLRSPRDRLSLPLFAIGWAALAEVVCSRAWMPSSATLRRGVVVVLLLAIAVSSFHYRQGWDDLAREHAARVEQARAWNERLPSDARIASAIGWHHSVYLGRDVYSLLFAVRRRARDADARGVRGAARNEMQAAEEVIDKYRVNTVILSGEAEDQWPLPYFERRYGPGVRAGDGWIFRVRP